VHDVSAQQFEYLFQKPAGNYEEGLKTIIDKTDSNLVTLGIELGPVRMHVFKYDLTGNIIWHGKLNRSIPIPGS
jgi:hypothetical protein